MKASFYDVTLRAFQESDKELIRYWRNHESVRSKMAFKDFITPEMHSKWFQKFLAYDQAFGNIIEFQQTSCGVAYYINNGIYSDGGMFFWDKLALGIHIPVLVSIIQTEINFYLFRQPEAHINILSDNYNAISFNKSLGYCLLPNQENEYSQRYILTEETYKPNGERIKKMLEMVYGYKDKIKIQDEASDIGTPLHHLFHTTIKQCSVEGFEFLSR